MLRDERREMLVQIESANYRLGAAESRLAQIEAPTSEESARDSEQHERGPIEATIIAVPSEIKDAAKATTAPEPRRSFFGR